MYLLFYDSCVLNVIHLVFFFYYQGTVRERHLMDIQENRNKTVLAQDVFASAIQALKEKAIDDMERNGTPASEEEIRWVLTVPAIWPDDAKLFMRESASQVKY